MRALAALALNASAALACNVTGTWVDRVGNIATLEVDPNGSITARSFSATRWATCAGRVINETAIWLAFHGAADNETGIVEANCSALVLPGAAPSVWGKTGDYLYGQGGVSVTDVHLIFMSHLDLGYTNLARSVCDEYFTSNLPANIALARALANSSTPYALTSHAFLVAEFNFFPHKFFLFFCFCNIIFN